MPLLHHSNNSLKPIIYASKIKLAHLLEIEIIDIYM